MKEMGVVVPIVTPCTLSGEIDFEGLKIVCKDMVDAGCHGIFAAGSTGRGPWFHRRERMKICSTIADIISPNKPLLAGCMAAGLGEMIENAKAAGDNGATIAIATAPMYFPYMGDEVESIFLKFADSSPLPVMIYDIPELVGAGITPKLLMKLAGHENIVGFKDSSANYENFKRLLEVLNAEKPDFYLMQGKEHLIKESLFTGASGLVVSLLHVDPRLFVAIYNAVRRGNIEMADRLQQAITKIMECLKGCFEKRLAFSTLSHFLNTALNARGIDVNIRLEHEGQCPDWIAAKAKEALEIGQTAISEICKKGGDA